MKSLRRHKTSRATPRYIEPNGWLHRQRQWVALAAFAIPSRLLPLANIHSKYTPRERVSRHVYTISRSATANEQRGLVGTATNKSHQAVVAGSPQTSWPRRRPYTSHETARAYTHMYLVIFIFYGWHAPGTERHPFVHFLHLPTQQKERASKRSLPRRSPCCAKTPPHAQGSTQVTPVSFSVVLQAYKKQNENTKPPPARGSISRHGGDSQTVHFFLGGSFRLILRRLD